MIKAEAGEPILVYPDSSTAFNPRLACVPPVDKGGTGKEMDIEATFTYQVGSLLNFREGGKLSFSLRDNLRRREKEILSLSNGQESVLLKVGRAADGRVAALVFKRGEKVISEAKLSQSIGIGWTTASLAWTAKEAVLTIGDQEVARLPLEAGFSPSQLTFQIYSLDQVALQGDGQLSLDWENGYAASATPASDAQNVTARAFGFDTFVVSQDATKRDFPTIQIINPEDKETTVSFRFENRSEVRHRQDQWKQEITVPARSSAWMPIRFPALPTDVYHLSIESTLLNEKRHFMFVERRGESEPSSKFALHDSNRNTFGEWPDALPIGISHLYARWRDTQGPPWFKDNSGDWGLSPDAPISEWNWDHRLDWAIGQGLQPYVCIESTPALPWMRERIVEGGMKQTKWDANGGFPKIPLFRNFVRALGERYKGKVSMYEIENEPYLVHHAGKPPEDYAKITQAAAEELHQIDPKAKIFINCGIGEYMAWTMPTFDAGAPQFVNGISLHTYTTPRLPDQANLPKNLQGLHKLITDKGRPLTLVNSETGVYTALREQVDQMIPPARLAELIEQGVPNLAVPTGWPNFAQDEIKGSTSMVQNAVENFAAGAEFFTFFGWNPKWPSPGWWDIQKGSNGDACFSILSASKDGERTPSLFTLGVGVLTAQLEGIKTGSGRQIDQDGVIGALFDKGNGGQLAVLWSGMGKRSVLIETSDDQLEIVSLHGESSVRRAQIGSGKALHIAELSDQPVYLHLRQPGFNLLPSPVLSIMQAGQDGDEYRLRYTLLNQSAENWKGEIAYNAPEGWTIKSATAFDLKPKERKTIEVASKVPPNTASGARLIEASLRLPDGHSFAFPITVAVRPSHTVPKVADLVALTKTKGLEIERPDQVVVGRPPEMASLQEDQYWKGPRELSGETWIGYTEEALLVKVRVHDAYARLPEPWPGVKGSCVELFFDFRSPSTRAARSSYEKGVYQIILAPSLAKDQSTQIWNASESYGSLPNLVAKGERIDADSYWVSLEIPWKSIGAKIGPGFSFGFDVAIDGPRENLPDRKSQMVLFGGASNSKDVSSLGNLTLGISQP